MPLPDGGEWHMPETESTRMARLVEEAAVTLASRIQSVCDAWIEEVDIITEADAQHIIRNALQKCMHTSWERTPRRPPSYMDD